MAMAPPCTGDDEGPLSSILSLPHELREVVVGELETPSDLLALALACRALYELIVPDYLEYCRIRTFIGVERFWEHLADHPVLARNVKDLVLCRRDYRIPRGFHVDDSTGRMSQETFREGVLKLAEALRFMSGLISFQFPPGVRGKNDEVWEALKEYCPKLRELVVWDWSPFDAYYPPIYQSKIFELRNLTIFKMYSAAYAGSTIPPATHRLRDFLLNCPTLQELLLVFHFVDRRTVTPVDSIFTSATWPHLRSLQLSYVSCGAEVVRDFFKRHPNIERLLLFDDLYDRVDLSAIERATVPRLRVFYGSLASLKSLARAEAPLEDVTLRWMMLNQEIIVTLEQKYQATGELTDDELWIIRIFEAVPRVVLTDGSQAVKAKMSSGKVSFQWESIYNHRLL